MQAVQGSPKRHRFVHALELTSVPSSWCCICSVALQHQEDLEKKKKNPSTEASRTTRKTSRTLESLRPPCVEQLKEVKQLARAQGSPAGTPAAPAPPPARLLAAVAISKAAAAWQTSPALQVAPARVHAAWVSKQ
eukprot:1161398-Pelagomonas_calceolata.AAC.2